MNITVLGCGRWGSFLAWYHAKNAQKVMLWGRQGSKSVAGLKALRKNDYLTLPENVDVTDDLGAALENSSKIIVCISAQHLRSLAKKINEFDVMGKTFILCMKGLECESGATLTTVVQQELQQDINIAVWVGPGHVQDFLNGVPNCQVVDSDNSEVISDIVQTMSTDLIRLYKGNDLLGTQIGAAAKNVIGIAAGMLDGRGMSSMKGALMARGAREIARLMNKMGANELSAYGLCHLGDYEATLFSKHSHNREFGEKFITKAPYGELAEGVTTVKALVKLSEEHGVDLPICKAVYGIIYEDKDPDLTMQQLFNRSVKLEFDI